ncbi:MAG: hypothetical protein EOM05_00845 [Clostridia bacterium]|nr:hypothetical protein [Clostridia bacterium]
MNKKIFTVCAMLIMCVFLFAACNNKDDDNVTTESAITTTTKESQTEDLGDRLSTAVSEAVTDISEMMPTTNIAS